MSYNLGQIDPDRRSEFYADPIDEEELAARPRRVLKAGAALLVMGLFAGGLWFAYVEGMRHSSGAGNGGAIPLIRADTRPIKIKPANPGGMAIPDRDLLIYGESRPAIEHLLPPPEQPMARPAPPAPAPTPPVQAPAPALPSAAPPVVVGPAPNAPLGSPYPPDSAPVAPARPEQRASAPATSLRPSKTASISAETNRAGAVRLQLGSVRSEISAREEWDRIKRSNADLLGGLSAAAVRADLGDKGVYYRIQAGPVAGAAADRICGELRQRHLGCIIVR